MLGHMNVRRLLIKLSIPAIAAMVFNALYNLVDTIFVGQGVNEEAIGALSIAYPIQLIVLSLGLMIGIGSASVFARAYGAGDKQRMKRVVNMALLSNIVISTVIAVVSLIFIEELLQLFGAVDDNIHYAREYLSVILIALVPYSLSITFNHLTRAEGRANVAMISLMIGAGLNILLDPFFIFDGFLGLGVRGAAMATGIAKTASFLFVIIMAHRPESALGIHLPSLHKVDPPMIVEIMKIGFPSFVRVSLGGILIIIVNNLLGVFAPVGQAAMYISIFGVINRLMRFSLMPGFGLVQGLIPIVGFNFGAAFYGRLREGIRFGVRLMVIYFAFVFFMVLFFAEPLFSIFSDAPSPMFIEEGARAFRFVALGFVFAVFPILLSSVYQAMGYARRALIVSVLRRFAFYVPFSLLFTYGFGLGVTGVWLAFFAADFSAGAVSFAFYTHEMRTLKRAAATS